MSGRVRNKVAIVTGAGSIAQGIGHGKAAAIVYAKEGARVALVNLNLAAARETKAIIDREGGECFAMQADVSLSKHCLKVVEATLEKYGRLDILHNNVGIEIPGGLDQTSEADWDRTIAVNLKSVFLMCKRSIKHMEQQGSGVIVNISSINAIRTPPALSLAYGVSKAGIDSLTREIAMSTHPKEFASTRSCPA